MNERLEKELVEKFPSIFRQTTLPPTESSMYFGCACEDGWKDLIYCAAQIMTNMHEYNPDMYQKVEFAQIKEKYGSLRLYYDVIPLTKEEFIDNEKANRYYYLRSPKFIKLIGKLKRSVLDSYAYKRYLKVTESKSSFYYGVTSYAEVLSSKTCEVCGEKGVVRKGGWIKTLCDKHHKEWSSKNNE